MCGSHCPEKIYRMKAVHLFFLLILVGALFFMLKGLVAAYALLDLAWSTISRLVNYF